MFTLYGEKLALITMKAISRILYCIQQSKILRKLACFIEEASLDYRLTMVFRCSRAREEFCYQGNVAHAWYGNFWSVCLYSQTDQLI